MPQSRFAMAGTAPVSGSFGRADAPARVEADSFPESVDPGLSNSAAALAGGRYR